MVLFFAAPATAMHQAQPILSPHPGRPAGVPGGVVELGHAVERNQNAAPVRDATAMRPHTDSEALRKLREKKITAGHKPEDHENEEQSWRQTMF